MLFVYIGGEWSKKLGNHFEESVKRNNVSKNLEALKSKISYNYQDISDSR